VDGSGPDLFQKSILHKIKETNQTGHTLSKNSLLKDVIEGDIKVMGRRGRRRELLLDDLKETGITRQ